MSPIRKYSICIITLVVISNCSFHSSQYELVKGLFTSNDIKRPQPNWITEWAALNIDIFAINHEGQIFFASYDDHLIQFKGNQVINVQGFFGDDAIVKIDLNDYRLRYTYNNKLIGVHKCYPWNDSSSLEAKIKIKEQICFDQQADYNYKNRIYTNTEDQIIALEFKIHPNYPSMKIQLKKYDQEIFNNYS